MPIHDWTRVGARIYHAFHREIAYEYDQIVRTDMEPVAVGDVLPDMPVFLYPKFYLDVPLEAMSNRAWEIVPLR